MFLLLLWKIRVVKKKKERVVPVPFAIGYLKTTRSVIYDCSYGYYVHELNVLGRTHDQHVIVWQRSHEGYVEQHSTVRLLWISHKKPLKVHQIMYLPAKSIRQLNISKSYNGLIYFFWTNYKWLILTNEKPVGRSEGNITRLESVFGEKWLCPVNQWRLKTSLYIARERSRNL